ncbi:hypothetical protein [Methylobacterium sp. J-068]|uniref:hypothetical protein n=1 Tax=Methylobacterium sp. J-068 TaxID=2836649 RepID=UPI001FBA4FB9|nr:hypothetical protein [Methylobacterium sp. J-068]MCJ2037043.1 hypothetical protein [Methylobacterium sp. J-068]
MQDRIPIFVFTCDRLKVLKQSIASYKKIGTHVELVFYDVGSTFQPTIDYLLELENSGYKIYRTSQRILSGSDLNNISYAISDWYSNNDAPYYVVTDPDIELDGDGYADIFKAYAYLLETMPDIEVVGPMLRIDDLPSFYPLKEKVIERHFEQFWHKPPLSCNWNGRPLQYQHALIDTTFGMYRKGTEFKRLRSGLRTYAPYAARHLDWYINPDMMTDDQIFYLRSATDVSHWGGTWLREKILGEATPSTETR